MGKSTIFVAVYVDDILLTENHLEEMDSLKTFLHSRFKIKDLGSLHYFLGIEFLQGSHGIIMTQRKFKEELLKEFDQRNATPAHCPLESNLKLRPDSGTPIPIPSLYRKLVGKLNYLTNTRPDLAYAVQYLSQFMQDPRDPHWQAALHTLRYLSRDYNKGIYLNASTNLTLEAYYDSDLASCANTRRSVSGYFILLGGSPISWKSKKQATVSTLPAIVPIPLKCDSQAAIYIAKNPVYHERTKHIDLDCHFVREKLQDGLISLQYVPTQHQLADVFTKSLLGPAHHNLFLTTSVDSNLSPHSSVPQSLSRSPSPSRVAPAPVIITRQSTVDTRVLDSDIAHSPQATSLPADSHRILLPSPHRRI
ncbi:uncharacterized mitochondrial protein AtMg00810-like [Amaranthus tricolor]|uniref:uncharacterized mitochondrial protein AtMg00810-like n=1 Tax=Amaranthus tricolor TaxID=29722 RepID=UPI00258825A7|nr:uncharacterized mitochondrial protein AtMg00810-like [Amaranthus tricolor]